jgi:hypothetical protein
MVPGESGSGPFIARKVIGLLPSVCHILPARSGSAVLAWVGPRAFRAVAGTCMSDCTSVLMEKGSQRIAETEVYSQQGPQA